MAMMRTLQDRLSSFTYELTDRVNFEEKKLHTYKDLVEHVKLENLRLLMENSTGRVTVTKVDRSLYAKAYFGKVLLLPQSEGTDWNRELVAFKTKQPIPFVIEPLKKDEENNRAIPQPFDEAPIIPDEKGKVDFEDEGQLVSVQSELMNPFESKEEEKNGASIQKALPAIDSVTAANKENEEPLVESLEETESAPLPSIEEKDFSEFIHHFKGRSLEQISHFISLKNQEMYDQVRQFDHRAEIREEVTADYNKQYSAKSQEISNECQKELEEQLKAEKIRHEQELQKIRSALKKEESTRMIELKEKLMLDKENEITRRFDKESERLAKVLEDKKAEVHLQQEQLKSELQEFLAKALKEVQTSQQTLENKLSKLNVAISEVKQEEVAHEVVERQRVEETCEIEAYR
ncbi:hypothetical protein [Lactococcus lactis]